MSIWKNRKENRFMMISLLGKLMLCSAALLFIQMSGCDGDSGEPIGSACDSETVCKGVCLISLPGGMCAGECDDDGACKAGECVKISGGYYCVPSCEEDADCRVSEGYLCVVGACRTPVVEGELCGKHEDCGQGTVCVAGHCSVPCLDSTVCDDGYYCLEEDGRSGCAPDDCSGGICGRSCETHSDCSYGTYCGTEGHCVLDSCDEDGVCEQPCEEHTDCTAGTYCALLNGEKHCVFLPEDKGEGTTGYGCSSEPCEADYICIKDGEEDAYSYCTEECTSDLQCPPGMFCGETMVAGGTLVEVCLRREFCEPCDFDGQCGFFPDKCVSVGDSGEVGFCSTACDPDRSDTCPVDNTCLQAFFCESLGLWVSDCAHCEGQCDPGEVESYQCFQDLGGCIGDGGLCSPCKHTGHCEEGGACLTMSTNGLKFCSAPCDEDDRCPPEYWCVEVSGFDMQCIPRKASCTEPSGGREGCELCQSFEDCLNGSCVQFGWSSFCFDECTPGLDECPPYSACEEVQDTYGLSWNLCMPQGDVDECSKFEDCLEQCPEGPESCGDNPPSYCL